ncbi:MAG TPA: FAD-dependent oxidoreductase [Glycomyces sp.]|nr:FAD-dependent oxidoreductase [Glycomyces sp.]
MADVAVVGAGVAGLATALFVSRAGGRVTLLEADAAAPPPAAGQSMNEWARPGVAQFGHGHSVHALARLVLLENAPDVLDELLHAGAGERRFGHMAPLEGTGPGDGDLTSLQVRRSVFEWVLRAAVERERGVSVRPGARAAGLAARRPEGGVDGVVLDSGETVAAPWVVDASGRRSALPRWLGDLGAGAVEERVQDSSNFYYARHFRFRPGAAAPSGDWLFGPTGDYGFLRYALLPEDAGHFVLTINVPKTDREFRCLRDPDVWLRAARALGGLDGWLGADVSEPVSPVFSIGGIRNVFRDFRGIGLAGVVPVGDALLHTNPTQGWGLSMALHHAREVAAAAAADRGSGAAALIRRLTAHGEPYYRVASAEDVERARLARGGAPAWERPGNPLFCRKIAYPQAKRDPELYRAVQRRIHLLEPPTRLTARPDLVRRALELHRSDPAASGRAERPPERDGFLERIGARTPAASLPTA